MGPTDLSAETAAVVAELRALALRLSETQSVGNQAMAKFIDGFFDRIEVRGSQASIAGMVALPLLIHGAETGDPEPARTLAMIHLLWWASARHLDDIVDGKDSTRTAVETNKETLAAIAVGSHLTVEMLAEEPRYMKAATGISPETRLRLHIELSRSWLEAVDGQLIDLTADWATATPDEVLHSYRGKTGAPYAMAAAMAAVLAGGDAHRVDQWREFGVQFGVLRQLVNDQRDLVSGRHEDLCNRTATYLLAHHLRSLVDHDREVVLNLLDAAAESEVSQQELAAQLLAPSTLRGYADSLGPLIDGLHECIERLSGVSSYRDELHGLVEETARFFPQFLLSPVTRAG